MTRPLWAWVVPVVALLAAGCGATAAPAQPVSRAATAGPAAEATTTTSPGAAAVPAPAGAVASTVARALRPVRISVPSVGVDASLTELGVASDGSIEVPSDPDQAGWLTTTPAPGQQGPAVIAGHVDSTTGPAVFYRLSSLAPGDPITVTLRDGTRTTFTVDGVRVYPQDAFPTAAVYGPVPGPALRLITCGGAYEKSQGGYQDNVVVYAS